MQRYPMISDDRFTHKHLQTFELYRASQNFFLVLINSKIRSAKQLQPVNAHKQDPHKKDFIEGL